MANLASFSPVNGLLPVTYTQSVALAANLPENITIPTDDSGLLARYVTIGSPKAGDYYAKVFTKSEGLDRVTNGNFTNYVTNGTFGTDTDWTKGTGWTIGTGVATAVTATSSLSQTSATPLIKGQAYTITFTATQSAGSVQVSVGGTLGTARSTSATFTESIVAGATQEIAFVGTGFSGTIDAVIMSAWTLGTGWTVDGAKATATGAISTAISQTINYTVPLKQGQAYLVTYDVVRSAGTITPSLGGTAGTARSTTATFSEVIISGATQALSFGTSGFTGELDNVSVIACASVPADVTTGLVAPQNPSGFLIPNNASHLSVVSGATPIITASFYKG